MAVATRDEVGKLARAIGEEKVSDSKSTLVAYRVAHGQEAFLHESDFFNPGVVVWPESVEDVQEIVRIANETKIPIVPVGGRTGSYGAEAMKGCIVLDPVNMNKIVEFDETKFRVTAEAGIRIADLTDYLAQRGYMLLDMPALANTSHLGSRAAIHGYNHFENRWGSTQNYIKGLEVVLPTGEVVQVGRGTAGLRIPTKSAMGYNLMDLFIGSRGTLGIITKVVEKVIKIPPVIKYDAFAFKTMEDGIKAFLDLKHLDSSTGSVWRVKGYHKYFLKKVFETLGLGKWPEDAERVTGYTILGQPDIVSTTEKYARDICESHHGFWRDGLPSKTDTFPVKTMEEYLGMGAAGTKRMKNGGVGNRMLPFDPVIPDAKLVEFCESWEGIMEKMKDRNVYPHLGDTMEILEPPSMVPLDEGFNKLWGVFSSNWEDWNTPVREEFISWYSREYAELVWKLGGSLTATHGFIPSQIEAEFIRKEIGEDEYKLMERIKDFLDPNHIMNPKVKFAFEPK